MTKLVLKRPVSTLLVILAIVVFGVASLLGMPMELMQDMNMPMQLVMVVYPGASASDVDSLVVDPIEDAVSTLSGVSSVTSYANENMAMVMLMYDYDTDNDDNYSALKEKLDGLQSTLPDSCQPPSIMEMSVNSMPTMMVSVNSNGSADALKYAEDTVVPELEKLSGVAQVETSGGTENYVQVLLNEEKMSQYGLNISTIAQMIGAADFTIPAGSVSNGNQDLSVSAVAELKDLESIRNVTLTTGTGALIHLSDVATVQYKQKDASSISRYNGNANISLTITKTQSASTMDVCKRIQRVLDRCTNNAISFEVTYTSADTIQQTMQQVLQTLAQGVLFTMAVLFLFFGDIKASLIVGSSMPISVLLAIVIINFGMGYSLNVMTGGALILAIGMIVDNSIVMLESCFRMREGKLPFREAALRGAGEVGASVLASTITTVVVYVPMAMVGGMSGQMLGPLAWTIVFVMIASLLGAVSVVPLAFIYLKPKAKEDLPINRLLAKFNRFYDKALRTVLHHKKITMLATAGMMVVAVFAATQCNLELIPSSYDGSISVTANFRSGTKLETMNQLIAPVEQMLLEDENFDTVNLSISGSSATISAYAVEGCKRSSEDAVTQYTRALEKYTNMDIEVAPSGGASSSMSSMGTSSVTEIDLQGTDLDALKQGASMVEEIMRQTPGVIRVANDFAQSQTTAHIVVDPQLAMNVGLAPAQVSMNVYNTLSGVDAADVTIDGEDYDVTVEYPKGRYDNITSLLDQPLSTPYGSLTTLGEIAHVEYVSALQTITRQNGMYQIAVTASTTGTARWTAQKSIEAAVAKLELPQGVSRSSSVLQDMQSDELTGLLKSILTAVFLVFLVMAMQFESVRFSLMVMTCIPFSLIGSFLLMYLSGTTFSMISMMGILMLMGIVVNNGILLVDTANQLRETGQGIEEALVQAGRIRIRPILMTTLTTILSMLPMLFTNDPTMKIMNSMAVVIIGGLVASTVLAMFVMPAFYMLLTRRKKRPLKRAAKGEDEQDLSDHYPECDQPMQETELPENLRMPGDENWPKA